MRKLIVVYFFFLVGDHKIDFIPNLVGPFLEMTLIPHSGKLWKIGVGRSGKNKKFFYTPYSKMTTI